MLTTLRPVERRHRLLNRMRLMGYRECKLPSVDAKGLGGSLKGLEGGSTEARAADWAGKRAATLDA